MASAVDILSGEKNRLPSRSRNLAYKSQANSLSPWTTASLSVRGAACIGVTAIRDSNTARGMLIPYMDDPHQKGSFNPPLVRRITPASGLELLRKELGAWSSWPVPLLPVHYSAVLKG